MRNASTNRRFRLGCVVLFVCLCLLAPAKPAHAESLHAVAVEIVVGIVAVSVALTVAIVLTIRHQPSVTGCAAAGPGGLQIQSQGDNRTYLLVGDTGGLKPGERIKVQGKKGNDATRSSTFFVEKLKKDYGPCKGTAATAAP
jgi:hypothetical protein